MVLIWCFWVFKSLVSNEKLTKNIFRAAVEWIWRKHQSYFQEKPSQKLPWGDCIYEQCWEAVTRVLEDGLRDFWPSQTVEGNCRLLAPCTAQFHGITNLFWSFDVKTSYFVLQMRWHIKCFIIIFSKINFNKTVFSLKGTLHFSKGFLTATPFWSSSGKPCKPFAAHLFNPTNCNKWGEWKENEYVFVYF